MLQRTPEPELMDDIQQAVAYDQADFSEPNARFIEAYAKHIEQHTPHRVLDLGCGPATICMGIAQQWSAAEVTCVDGSAAMIQRAAQRLAKHPDLSGRVHMFCQTLPLPLEMFPKPFDVVISNSLLHHLHDPSILWKEVLAQTKKGGFVLVGDLKRPASTAQASSLVQMYAADEPEVLRTDFYNSLLAAFTAQEVREQLKHVGLELEVQETSDRHMLIWGHVPN